MAKVLRIRGSKANRGSGPVASAGSPAMPIVLRTKLRRVVRRPRMLSSDHRVRRTLRRNRVFLVTLLVVGALVAILIGFGGAHNGAWYPNIHDLSRPPSARFGAASVFDQARNRVVLFGGFVGTTDTNNPASLAGPPISNNDETWLWNGGWQRRDPRPRPSARGYAAIAYDGARQNVVLFGGAPYNTNNVSGETWIWDGAEWTLQNPPKPVPDPRQNAAMVYDPHHNGGVVMMFGGRGADGKPMNDTWIWNGTSWKIMPPEGAPSPRHSAAIAYDTCRAKAVMFGGVGDPINNFHFAPSETWTWDGAKWTPRAPLVSPPGRIGGSLAYSPRTGNLLLYGGLITNDAGVPTAATDNAVWRWVPDPKGLPPDSPPAQRGFWERMNSEPNAVVGNIPPVVGDGIVRSAAPPRAFATFVAIAETGWGGAVEVFLFGGTPAAAPPPLHTVLKPTEGAQFAYGDQFVFVDRDYYDLADQRLGGAVNDPKEPLIRECPNPVPIPDDAPVAGEADVPQGPKTEVREGMREIDQLPVLLGTDWPAAQRNTHKNYNGGPPNPDYTPPPDCPNRSTSSPQAATSGNNETGSNTYLVTDSPRNRVYQFFLCDPNRGRGYVSPTSYGDLPQVFNLLIGAYDGTTLEPLGQVMVPSRYFGTFGNLLRDFLFDDADRGRFLFRSSDNELKVIDKGLIEKGVNPITGTIDITGMPPAGVWSRNFFRHPTTDRPKVFYFQSGSFGQWDLASRKSDWTASCSSGSFAMHSGDRVYTACNVDKKQWAVVRISLTANPDGSETPGAVEVFPGPSSNDAGITVWGDSQAERMVLLTHAGGQKIWTFDGKVSRWVGRAALGEAAPSGQALGSEIKFRFDDTAGRLYVYMTDSPIGNTRGGVRIVDTRLTPVPQAVDLPQFAFTSNVPPAFLAGRGDARRVFIKVDRGKMKKYPNWETVEFENEMFYRVLADEVPVPKALGLSDLDALTVPVPETPGKTEVSFDAEGSAYGIRLRSIGGIWTAARPFQQAYSGWPDDIEGIAMSVARHLIPACVFPDRELMAGFVPQARLSDLDALARSSGLEVDSNSKVDLTGLSSRCQPTADASNFPPSIKTVFDVLWPLKLMLESTTNQTVGSGVTAEAGQQSGNITEHIDTPLGTLDVFKNQGGTPTGAKASTTSSAWDKHFKEVVCVGDALKTYQAAVGNIYGSSDCVQTKGLVKATARGSATGVGPLAEEATKQGFSVGEGYSNVVVSRDPEKGVVVTSTAVAKGIQIPGLSIDRVETTAVAWSNGRPGEERALFTRDICGVHTPDGSIPGCLSSGNQQEFVTRWNSGWGKNSQIYLPKPDPGYYNGSPGGYIAGVLKPLANEIEDQLFAKDFQKEVPGIEIHFYKDSQYSGDARQTLQLAAVRAIAGFGVQCNPDYLYSPQTNTTPATCVLIPEDLPEEEYWEEGEDEFFEEEEESELDGEWISADALGPTGPSLGSRIGKLLENLPVIRQLPIREIAEALLAGSVWWLLGLPLFLASRRFALSQWRTN